MMQFSPTFCLFIPLGKEVPRHTYGGARGRGDVAPTHS
jgi:hypothetical protein